MDLQKYIALDQIESRLSRHQNFLVFFQNVNSFDDLIAAFDDRSKIFYSDFAHSKIERRRVILSVNGDTAFHEYGNFFFKRFSSPYQNDLWDSLGVRVRYTDQKSDIPGIENVLTDEDGNLILAETALTAFQHRYEGDSSNYAILGAEDIGDFLFNCIAHQIPKERRIIFTSLPKAPVFDEKWKGGNSQFTILGSELQRQFIETDPAFFKDFRKELRKKAQAADTRLIALKAIRKNLIEMKEEYARAEAKAISDAIEMLKKM